MRPRLLAGAALAAVVAAALWWRKNPSACPYGQRFWVEAPHPIITRDRLLSEVWDLHWDSSTKTLDMHIHALRRKLLDDPETSRWITTIRGIGYRFETP